MSNNKSNTKKNHNSLITSFKRFVNGDDAKLESNIVDVNKSHEDYIKKHEGEEKRKFKFFWLYNEHIFNFVYYNNNNTSSAYLFL